MSAGTGGLLLAPLGGRDIPHAGGTAVHVRTWSWLPTLARATATGEEWTLNKHFHPSRKTVLNGGYGNITGMLEVHLSLHTWTEGNATCRTQPPQSSTPPRIHQTSKAITQLDTLGRTSSVPQYMSQRPKSPGNPSSSSHAMMNNSTG